ncbi:MAG TPA: ribose-phosphate pyrophosphokinase [Planctomycetota bacterium]|nr:ribose-phosphate pyrophosphokinase [Planctomycetota bacterium]
MGPASPLLVFSGNSNKSLAERICAYLGIPMGEAKVGRFPDGETEVKIQSDVRGADVFVVQSTCAPVNDHLMELLIMIDALKRASAARITAVVPYFGYARQDRKDEGRVPISAKLVANLIQASGVNRVLTIDLHAAQIQGFFDIPLDHLYAMRVFAKYVKKLELPDLVVASPDVGGMKTAWAYAKRFGARLAVVEKRRTSAENVEVGFVIGEVEGKNVILVDDLIATGGTIAKAAKLLREKGAKEVFIMATHPVFCGRAIEKLREAPVKEIIVTDTIPVTAQIERLNVLSVAELLGEAVHRIHTNKSVSLLFRKF